MGKIHICYCGEPLVFTFMFRGAEYFCVRCGSKLGVMDSLTQDKTPELSKRLTLNKAMFSRLSKGLLTGGVMFTGCNTCSKQDEAHINHATQEELTAHEKALKKLKKITL